MNKVLLILSLVLLASCSPKEVPIDMLVEMQGLKYTFNSDTPFTGISFENDENGQLQTKEHYKDGKLQIEENYENGQLDQRRNYKDGKQEGLYELYYPNGQLAGRVNLKDGKLDGLREDYAENGQLALTGCYNNGKEVDMSYCEQ